MNIYLQGSDGGSVVFASTPAQAATTAPSPTIPRKNDFPSTGLPISNGPLGLGGSASPNQTSQTTTVSSISSPATAALPPPNLPPPYPTPMQVCFLTIPIHETINSYHIMEKKNIHNKIVLYCLLVNHHHHHHFTLNICTNIDLTLSI